MATLCPSALAALAHDSPPGENQLSSLSFSERHLKLERYRGKWLQHGWPNRRDREWRRRQRRRGICNEDYLDLCRRERERGENIPFLSRRLLFLERDGVIDPEENQLSPLDGAKWCLPSWPSKWMPLSVVVALYRPSVSPLRSP